MACAPGWTHADQEIDPLSDQSFVNLVSLKNHSSIKIGSQKHETINEAE